MFTGDSTPNYQDTIITNDGFWPDVNVGDFERRRGVPAVQDADRVAFALANAMTETNRQLEKLKAEWKAKGVDKANDIPAFPKVKSMNAVVVNYMSAITARAKADLMPDFASISQRKVGDHLAERAEETRDGLLAESQRSIRSMLGRTRSGVRNI